MNHRTADMMKVSRVIKSCKTREQLDVATKMAKNFQRAYLRAPGDVPNFEPIFIYFELLKEINTQIDFLKI